MLLGKQKPARAIDFDRLETVDWPQEHRRSIDGGRDGRAPASVAIARKRVDRSRDIEVESRNAIGPFRGDRSPTRDLHEACEARQDPAVGHDGRTNRCAGVGRTAVETRALESTLSDRRVGVRRCTNIQ